MRSEEPCSGRATVDACESALNSVNTPPMPLGGSELRGRCPRHRSQNVLNTSQNFFDTAKHSPNLFPPEAPARDVIDAGLPHVVRLLAVAAPAAPGPAAAAREGPLEGRAA